MGLGLVGASCSRDSACLVGAVGTFPGRVGLCSGQGLAAFILLGGRFGKVAARIEACHTVACHTVVYRIEAYRLASLASSFHLA